MRFIQVGVGGFGRVWRKVLQEERRAKVVARVDVSAEALEQACRGDGFDPALCFSSLPKALKEIKADGLVCVTPPERHRKVVEAGLRAGLHVISEKPMAGTMADCRSILATAKKSGKCFVVSQDYRYQNAMQTIGALIRKGRIGTVGQIFIDFYKGFRFEGFRSTLEHPLLIDMAVHHFDLIRFLTGSEPVAVRGEAWNPPWSHYRGKSSSSVIFEMSGGARAVYSGSWSSQGDYCDWNGNWQIEGSRGTIRYQNGAVTRHEVPREYKVKRVVDIKPKKLRKEGQALVLDKFLRCVASGERPETGAVDNIRSVAMVLGAVRAVRTGKRINLKK